MFERFTDRARRVMVLSQEEARSRGHTAIHTEHLLLALVREGGGVAATVLESMDIPLDSIRAHVEGVIGRSDAHPTGHIPFTPEAKKALALALREALALGHNYIGTEHLLLGLIRQGECVAARSLRHLGADLERTREQVVHFVGAVPWSPRVTGSPEVDARLEDLRAAKDAAVEAEDWELATDLRHREHALLDQFDQARQEPDDHDDGDERAKKHGLRTTDKVRERPRGIGRWTMRWRRAGGR
jgi:ATP-dependent Clp protease ATP-binding subunit ClpA